MIYKRKMLYPEFAEKISALSGCYNTAKNNSEPKFQKLAKQCKSLRENLLKYFTINVFIDDINNTDLNDEYVHYTIVDNELELFCSMDSYWVQFDTDPINIKEYYIQKKKKYLEDYDKQRGKILEEYQKYLDSNEANDKGKKSKADFARKYGYKPSSICDWISGRNRPCI